MHIQEVQFGTPLHDVTVRLRYEILRKPLNLDFTVEQMEAEFHQVHIACINDLGAVIACLVVKKDRRLMKIRQVAVVEKYRRQGIGAKLNTWAEVYMKKKGFKNVVLHARVTAAPFYEKLGYTIVGDLFEEVSVDHYKMVKEL